MNTEAGLLAAVRANPDDDTARLVLADWYEEHGTTDQHRARAEWIRLTCDDTGRKTRKVGERKWVAANAHRLWPRLVPEWLLLNGVRFTKGAAVLSVRRALAGKSTYSVYVTGRRGVTWGVWFKFEDASWLAPRAAADEPCAILHAHYPGWAADWDDFGVRLNRHAFKDHGLLPVYQRVPASEYFGGHAKAVAAPLVLDFYPWIQAGFDAVDAELTAWAREHARNPLTGLTEQPA